MDIYQEEFKLVCGEGCLQSELGNKIVGDKSKLLREEKEPELAIREICKKFIDSKSWLCQWIELHCHFSAVHITKHKYLVSISEFSPDFPCSFWDLMESTQSNIFLLFGATLKKITLTMKRIVEKNKEGISAAKSITRRLSFSLKQPNIGLDLTWFTPLHVDRSLSRSSIHIVYESGIHYEEEIY